MPKSFYTILILLFTILIPNAAVAECNCKQPAYKDEIDFLTCYTACLEECFSTQFEQIRLKIDSAGARITDLEAQIDRLNSKVKKLEAELTSVKANK